MLQLIKAEIEYNKYPLIVGFLFPIIFGICSAIDVKVFQKVSFLQKYFWTILVCFGLYFILYAIWAMRIKEKRDRLHSLLPLKINQISITRYTFGLIPLLAVVIYLQLLKQFINADWQIFVNRINIQLAMFFVFLISLLIVRDLWFSFSQKFVKYKLLNCGLAVTFILLFTASTIYISTFFIKEQGADEILFWSWGFLLSFSSPVIFIKRDNYIA